MKWHLQISLLICKSKTHKSFVCVWVCGFLLSKLIYNVFTVREYYTNTVPCNKSADENRYGIIHAKLCSAIKSPYLLVRRVAWWSLDIEKLISNRMQCIANFVIIFSFGGGKITFTKYVNIECQIDRKLVFCYRIGWVIPNCSHWIWNRAQVKRRR